MIPLTESKRPYLLIEDLDSDFETTARGFRRKGVTAPVIRFSSIAETDGYLSGKDKEHSVADLPGVIILDLKLADGDGSDLLTSLTSNADLDGIPVLIWSSNSDPAVVDRCYRQGAALYLLKEAERNSIDETIECFIHHWSETVHRDATAD